MDTPSASIGIGKNARRAYGFDDVTIVPSRRTRDTADVSTGWDLDAYHFELPILSAAMDSVTSPATAIDVGRLGGLGVLNLEGIWTRYADPEPLLQEVSTVPAERAVARLREIYAAPVQEELVAQRVAEMKAAGGTVAGALTPARTASLHKVALDAGLDVLVIQGTVVSAQHVSSRAEPLNLKTFIAALDTPVVVGGCANYVTALHLMRTGAAALLVGIGSGRACKALDALGVGVPMATAVADAAGARRDYLDESGGRYVHIIADGGMRTGGAVATAIACGADAVMLGQPLAHAWEAPGRGWHWGSGVVHPTLPRGARVPTPPLAPLAEILLGPSSVSDGTTNLGGALRASMAMTGYSTLKEFQKVEVMLR